MKFVIVTNIPAPYRIPIYNLLGKKCKENFLVIFCARTESNRKWDLDRFGFNHIFLKERVSEKKDGRFIHNNPDVSGHLKTFNPDAVITTGFNPTFLYAWMYCLTHGKKHIPMTDGWIVSEKDLSFIHRAARKMVYSTSKAFIGASKNSFDLYKAYGIEEKRMFQSHLCIDNGRFFSKDFEKRDYDLMFSGQFIERKLPFFFTDVVSRIAKKVKNLNVLVLGSGPEKERFLKALDNSGARYDYPGFISQKELPACYNNTKLFLFPTRLDPWGIVANEAMASGTPVITTPFAGIVNDLLIDEMNGLILDIDPELWAYKITDLLQNKQQLEEMSLEALEKVKEFNFTDAARGIEEAVEYSLKK